MNLPTKKSKMKTGGVDMKQWLIKVSNSDIGEKMLKQSIIGLVILYTLKALFHV
ncbi:hypothetical protein [Bacillus phage SPO1L4]|nr:hypothetical protein [Bacillus phage SPO1L4]